MQTLLKVNRTYWVGGEATKWSIQWKTVGYMGRSPGVKALPAREPILFGHIMRCETTITPVVNYFLKYILLFILD